VHQVRLDLDDVVRQPERVLRRFQGAGV